MSYCDQCGQAASDGAEFCAGCGNHLTANGDQALGGGSQVRNGRPMTLAMAAGGVLAVAVLAVLVLRPPAASSGPVLPDEHRWVLQALGRNGVEIVTEAEPDVLRAGKDEYLVQGEVVDRAGNSHARTLVWNQGDNLVVLSFDEQLDQQRAKAMKAVLRSQDVLRAIDPEYIAMFELQPNDDGFGFQLTADAESSREPVTLTGIVKKTMVGYRVVDVDSEGSAGGSTVTEPQ